MQLVIKREAAPNAAGGQRKTLCPMQLVVKKTIKKLKHLPFEYDNSEIL